MHGPILVALLLVGFTFAKELSSRDESNLLEELILVDKNGNPVKRLDIISFVRVEGYSCQVDGRVQKFNVTPDLPPGISLSFQGILSGVTTSLMNDTAYTITAIGYYHEILTYNFTLSVSECSYGPTTTISVRSEGELTLFINDTIFLQQVMKREEYICMPLLEYRYAVNCSESSLFDNCVVIFSNQNRHPYKRFLVPLGRNETGVVSLINTGPPVISIQPFITMNSRDTLQIQYECEGIQEKGLVVSGGREMRVYIEDYMVQVMYHDPGLFNYQLAISNSKGTGTANFTLAVDVCPEGYQKLSISERGTYGVIFEIFTSEGIALFSNCLTPQSYPNGFFCARTNTPYLFHLKEPFQRGWDKGYPLQILDSVGVISEFRLDRNVHEDTRHFYITSLLPANSSLSFTKQTPAGSWTSIHFKENWPKSHSGAWGFYEGNKHMYIRGSFTAQHLERYSILYVDVITDDLGTVFINGEELIHLTQLNSTNYQRFVLPLSYLQEGDNRIAVELSENPMKVNVTAIHFDLNLFVVTSRSLQVSVNGNYTATQPYEDPKHPISKAFDGKTDTYWNVTGYPASVEYTFPLSQKRVANLVLMHQTFNDTPNALRIEGLDDDGKAVVLHTLRSNVFMTENLYEFISFDNTAFYRGYRVVFEGSVHNIPVGVVNIQFLYNKPLSCPKRFAIDSTSINSVTYKSCPFYRVGEKQIRCVDQDNQGVWVDDSSACLSKHPKRPYSYVDSLITIEGLYIDNFEKVKSKLVELIIKNIIVLEEEISFIMLKDVSTTDVYNTQISIRFTVDYRVGDYIHFRLTNNFIPVFSELVKTYLGEKYIGSFVDEPQLFNPPNWLFIISVSLAVLLFVCIIVLYLRVRSNTVNEPKKLHKKLIPKRGSLLDESDI